ncbi:transposase [Candidatus Riflebacteria bacterium]
MKVFFSDADRKDYLDFLSELGEEVGLTFLSYCLLEDQILLVVVPRNNTGLARGVGEAHRRYTRLVNMRESTKGYLFQGRFYSCPLDNKHMLAAVKFVERTPVRKGLCKKPWDYLFSSARFRVGKRKSDPLLSTPELVKGIDNFREFLAVDPDEMAYVESKLRTGRPCGDRRFIVRAEKITGRRLQPLPAGRPPAGAAEKPKAKDARKKPTGKKPVAKKPVKKTPVKAKAKKQVKSLVKKPVKVKKTISKKSPKKQPVKRQQKSKATTARKGKKKR